MFKICVDLRQLRIGNKLARTSESLIDLTISWTAVALATIGLIEIKKDNPGLIS